MDKRRKLESEDQRNENEIVNEWNKKNEEVWIHKRIERDKRDKKKRRRKKDKMEDDKLGDENQE